jgi:hypothetical protein
MSHVYIGIDPGLTGAFAVLEDPHTLPTGKPKLVTVEDLPVSASNPKRLDPIRLRQRLYPYISPNPAASTSISLTITIERAQAATGQGVSSIFNYGVNFGLLLGCLTHLTHGMPNFEILEPGPAQWKIPLKPHYLRQASHPAQDSTPYVNQKRHALLIVRDLFPNSPALGDLTRMMDHNRAEAALIAYWGMLAATSAVPRFSLADKAKARATSASATPNFPTRKEAERP